MKLDKLVELIKAKSNSDNPEIKIATPEGFKNIRSADIAHRKEYYDELLFGDQLKKGDFIVLDFLDYL